MEELAELLVLASEQLKEDGEDDGGADIVFSAHHFQARHESHANFRMQD